MTDITIEQTPSTTGLHQWRITWTNINNMREQKLFTYFEDASRFVESELLK